MNVNHWVRIPLIFLLLSVATVTMTASETRDEIYIPDEYDNFYTEWRFAPAARSGDLVFVAGVIGFKKGLKQVKTDPEQQYRAAFDILADILSSSGATLNDIIDLTTFHTPGSDRALFAKVKNEYMQGPAYPAWTAVTVSELSFGAIVEIKAVAIRGWSPDVNRERQAD